VSELEQDNRPTHFGCLQRLVAQLVIADGRYDERGRLGRGILSEVDGGARGIGESRRRLGGSGLGVLFPSEQIVRAITRHTFEKVCERSEMGVPAALVIKDAGAEEIELGAMIGVAVDLAMVELDRSDGLVGGKAREALGAQPAVTAMAFVLL